MIGPSRRAALAQIGAICVAPIAVYGDVPIRLGLTPVFLDNDAEVILRLQEALAQGTGRAIELVQWRTCQEATGLLHEAGVNAAWLCGFPFLQHEQSLALLGVPIWRGGPCISPI